jgi:hypothetical protein
MAIKYHPLYNRWRFIKGITENPNDVNYQRYAGGHGIENHFNDFHEFSQWVEQNLGIPSDPKARLHRIDPNDHFRPGNLAWGDQRAVTRRQRNVVQLKYKNKSQIISEWAEEYGISYSTMIERYNSGWTMPQMLGLKPGPRQAYIMKKKKAKK